MRPLPWSCFVFWCTISHLVCIDSFVHFDKEKKDALRAQVEGMFYHAYNSYMENAFPLDELRPLTCDGVDTWGSYSLTLIDALDTLAVIGNHSEFRRVALHLSESLNFDQDVNVSVFETNIRVVGGLLAAHMLSKRAGLPVEDNFPCSGPLLRLAETVARRLLPAFQTKTGMPYGTVNLRHGVPPGETPITCTSGVGTFILEFGILTRLTGDRVYEDTAIRAIRALWQSRTTHGLVGNHIDVETGQWKAIDAGIGAGVDSYYEYLMKAGAALQDTELMASFLESYEAIERFINHDDWYFWVSSATTHITMAIFQSLEAFWPGVLATTGDASSAYRSLMHYFYIWRHFGGTPEFFDITKAREVSGREGYPLRPELIECIYHLYQVNKDPELLRMGESIFHSIEKTARVPCGYATIKNVRTQALENRMESFFLAETIKYLYLLFDEDNFIHFDNGIAEVHETAHGNCVVSSGNFVFNTEAHPFDISYSQCCSVEKQTADHAINNLLRGLDIPLLTGLTRREKNLGRKMASWLYSEYERQDVGNSQFGKQPPLENADEIALSKVGKCEQPAKSISRTFEEYCSCDVPFSLFVKTCIKTLPEFLMFDRISPARFCKDYNDIFTKSTPFQPKVSTVLIPEGDPAMLTCTVNNELDLIAYGEINPR